MSARSCLILFGPRSGSSLLIQTLRQLGHPILGEAQTGCRPEANPRGYYDIPAIRDHGLTEELRISHAGQWEGRAVKVMLSVLVSETALHEHWPWISGERPRLFLTYRHPLEQVLSYNAVFQRHGRGTKLHFVQVTRGLVGWAHALLAFARIVQEHHPDLESQVSFFGYHEHVEAPAAFVARVAERSGLRPTADQFRAALANIDQALHRFRAAELPAEYQEWYDKLPCREIYEALRHDPVGFWQRVREGCWRDGGGRVDPADGPALSGAT